MSKKRWAALLLLLASPPSYADWGDPTRPAYPIKTGDAVVDTEGEPRLSAIWIFTKSRWATINGIQVEQGQSLSGNIKIVNISKNSVTINQNGTIKTLQLLQRPYK
ncbi:MAG: hypothetical protein Q8N96_03230 [Methylovulum sp.]|nr:hypothetical protein [Methylovulum sp.]